MTNAYFLWLDNHVFIAFYVYQSVNSVDCLIKNDICCDSSAFRNIEDILREKGETVVKITDLDDMQFIPQGDESWLMIRQKYFLYIYVTILMTYFDRLLWIAKFLFNLFWQMATKLNMKFTRFGPMNKDPM